jgi:hypothetical protein
LGKSAEESRIWNKPGCDLIRGKSRPAEKTMREQNATGGRFERNQPLLTQGHSSRGTDWRTYSARMRPGAARPARDFGQSTASHSA